MLFRSGAFDTSTSADELAKAIANNGPGKDVRKRSSQFFADQVDMGLYQAPAERAADVIARIVARS